MSLLVINHQASQLISMVKMCKVIEDKILKEGICRVRLFIPEKQTKYYIPESILLEITDLNDVRTKEGEKVEVITNI